MKPLLLFCLLTTLSFTSCEVKNTTKNKKLADNTPVKFIMENKYGLFNPLTKEVVVNPEYLYIENYSSGFCMASKGSDGELCDIIDLSGKKIFSYRNAPLSNTYCYNGLFSFVYDCNGEYYHGLYNSRGNIVYKSDFIYGMNDECFITKEKNYYIFNFTNEKGKITKKIKLSDEYDYKPFKNGYAKFSVIQKNERRYGIIDQNKTVVIKPDFLELDDKNIDGLRVAKNDFLMYGVINEYGEWEIPAVYEKIYILSTNTIAVKKDNWKIIDVKSNIIKDFPDNISIESDFFNDLQVFSINKKYGILNINGEILLNSICDQIEPNPDNGYWQVLINNKWMLFKEDEGLLDPEKYLNFTERK